SAAWVEAIGSDDPESFDNSALTTERDVFGAKILAPEHLRDPEDQGELAEIYLRAHLQTMKAGGALLRKLLDASIDQDLSDAEVHRDEAGDHRRGLRAMW